MSCNRNAGHAWPAVEHGPSLVADAVLPPPRRRRRERRSACPPTPACAIRVVGVYSDFRSDQGLVADGGKTYCPLLDDPFFSFFRLSVNLAPGRCGSGIGAPAGGGRPTRPRSSGREPRCVRRSLDNLLDRPRFESASRRGRVSFAARSARDRLIRIDAGGEVDRKAGENGSCRSG